MLDTSFESDPSLRCINPSLIPTPSVSADCPDTLPCRLRALPTLPSLVPPQPDADIRWRSVELLKQIEALEAQPLDPLAAHVIREPPLFDVGVQLPSAERVAEVHLCAQTYHDDLRRLQSDRRTAQVSQVAFDSKARALQLQRAAILRDLFSVQRDMSIATLALDLKSCNADSQFNFFPDLVDDLIKKTHSWAILPRDTTLSSDTYICPSGLVQDWSDRLGELDMLISTGSLEADTLKQQTQKYNDEIRDNRKTHVIALEKYKEAMMFRFGREVDLSEIYKTKETNFDDLSKGENNPELAAEMEEIKNLEATLESLTEVLASENRNLEDLQYKNSTILEKLRKTRVLAAERESLRKELKARELECSAVKKALYLRKRDLMGLAV